MIHSTQPQFVTCVGVELTYMPKEIVERREIYTSNVSDERDELEVTFTKALQKAYPRSKNRGSVLFDCGGVVEVPSPVFEDYKTFADYYHVIRSAADNVGAQPMDRFYATGGGHIHFDAFSKEHMFKLFRDFAMRPYLNWFFNDINDNKTANHCIWGLVYQYWYRFWEAMVRSAFLYNDEIDTIPRSVKYFGLNGVAVCKPKPHLEMRVFGAPLDWEEQQLQMWFLQAYVAWVDKQELKPVDVVNELQLKGRTKRWGKNRCIREFRELIAAIGLDPRDYERWVPRLEDRISFGPKWLI